MKYIFTSLIGTLIGAGVLFGFGVYLLTQQEEEGVGAPSANLFREISPVSDDQWDVGTTTARWRRVFAQYASSTAGSFFNQIDIGNTSTTTIRGDAATSTFSGGVDITAGGIKIGLPSCTEALETDSEGAIICGVDADSGAGTGSNWEVIGASGSHVLTSTSSIPISITGLGTSTMKGGFELYDNFAVGGTSTSTIRGSATSTIGDSLDIADALEVGSNAGFIVHGNAPADSFLLGGNGNVGIGVSEPVTNLDILTTNDAAGGIRMQSSLSDATLKNARLKLGHYTNSEEPITIFLATANSGSTLFQFGGGSTVENAATSIGFFTAQNNTTTTGTQRLTINNVGRVGVATTVPAQLFSVEGDAFIVGGLGIGDATTTDGVLETSGLAQFGGIIKVASGTSTFEGGINVDAIKTNLPDCDSLDTDSTGAIICGTDATGAGGSGTEIFELFNNVGLRATTTGKSLFVRGDLTATSSQDLFEVAGDAHIQDLLTVGSIAATGTADSYVTGSLGIGTTSPGALFAIANRAGLSDGKVPLFTVASSTASATTTLFTILNNGNVGIGTSTPTQALEFGENQRILMTSNLNNESGELIRLRFATSTNPSAKAAIAFQTEEGETKAWLVAHDYLSFPDNRHQHFSIETTKVDETLSTRMEFPYDCDACTIKTATQSSFLVGGGGDFSTEDGDITAGAGGNIYTTNGDVQIGEGGDLQFIDASISSHLSISLFPHNQQSVSLNISTSTIDNLQLSAQGSSLVQFSDAIATNPSLQLGVGTTSMWGMFNVRNTSNKPSLVVEDDSSDSSPFIIDHLGHVAIGTDVPIVSLNPSVTISGASPGLYIEDNDLAESADGRLFRLVNNNGLFSIFESGRSGNATVGSTELLSLTNVGNVWTRGSLNASSTLHVTGVGLFDTNVGIGTSTPWGTLSVEHIAGESNLKPIFLVGDTGTTTPYFSINQHGQAIFGTTTEAFQVSADATSTIGAIHTPYLMIDSGHNGTSTIQIGDVGNPGCIKMRDATDDGWSYFKVQDGVLSASLTSCE